MRAPQIKASTKTFSKHVRKVARETGCSFETFVHELNISELRRLENTGSGDVKVLDYAPGDANSAGERSGEGGRRDPVSPDTIQLVGLHQAHDELLTGDRMAAPRPPKREKRQRLITSYLQDAHRDGPQLAGVVYLHNVASNRMTGTAAKGLRMLRALCGADNLANVTLTTTMWDGLTDSAVGERGEAQLLSAKDF